MAPIFTGGIIGGELRKKREANRLLREARRKTQKEIWCYKSIFFFWRFFSGSRQKIVSKTWTDFFYIITVIIYLFFNFAIICFFLFNPATIRLMS